MAWFRLDDQGSFHAKVLDAGNEAYGAWCRGGQWSSGHGTEGKIPRSTALTIARQRIWDRLVAARLCESLGDDGWQIHDFLDWNPAVEVVEGRRATRAEAGRQGGLKKAENVRARQLAATKPVPNVYQKPAPIPIPIPIPERSEIPEPGVVAKGAEREPEKPRLTTFEEPFWKAAYAETIREAVGSWAFPDRQARSIRAAIEGHCTDYGNIDAWLRAKVAAFVVATRDRASYYAALGPDGFAKWLNEESAAAPREIPRPIEAPSAPAAPEREYTPDELAAIDARLDATVEGLNSAHLTPNARPAPALAVAGGDPYEQTPAEREAERQRQLAALAAITGAAPSRVA